MDWISVERDEIIKMLKQIETRLNRIETTQNENKVFAIFLFFTLLIQNDRK